MADDKQNQATVEPAAANAGPPREDRRTALRVIVGVGAAAYAGALAVPAVRFATSTSAGGEAGKARWIRVGRLDDLPEGAPRRLQVVGDQRDAFTLTKDQTLGSVWITRKGTAVEALSATCPHLGCSIDLNPDGKSFACPCHASRFSLAGKPEAGPSPRDMDPLAARVVDGWVEIDFRRFVIGVTSRKEA